ncbi:MAG: SDR family oxidoreductase [Pirellulales bacterium]|nr:SDR family oxidoreductase [Pirellulales bacterium]
MKRFDGQVALVTGGARRIGAVVARTLATAGYRIAIHANHSIAEAEVLAAELTAAGSPSLALVADVRDETAVAHAVDAVHRTYDRIDALVNCAAIWRAQRLEAATADDLREHFAVNTLGTFLFCQHVGRIMVDQPSGGAIVNIGDWAIARPYLDHAAYFASKGSIPTLTRTFAVELASRNPNIRVNAILPGPVLLPADLSPADRAEAIAGTLLKREGNPQNIADTVLFLVANDFITGVNLAVDGGRTIAP